MAHFVLRLDPPRPGFPEDASPAEIEAMAAHFAFWQEKAEAGVALAVGPVADPAGLWGLALVDVADEAAATGLVAEDPVIRAGLGFSCRVMPILSLIQGRARRPAGADS